MKIISKQLYLKPAELRDTVIPHDTLYRKMSEGDLDVIEDEEQGKLIPYSQLKKAWRDQIDATHGGNAYQYAQFQLIAESLTLQHNDLQQIDGYKFAGIGLELGRKKEYKAAAEVLAWLKGLQPFKKYQIAKYGCDSVKEFWLLVRAYNLAQNIKLPTSRRIEDKLVEYNQQGVICLIHKGFGNENSAKLAGDREAQALLLQLYAGNGNKLSYRETWRIFQGMAAEKGNKKLANISQQTVFTFLTEHDIEITEQRDGKAAYHNQYELRIHRRKLHAPHLQWEIDGTPAPLWFINEEGKPDRLYVAIVMDSMSRAFVGYALGYTEDTALMIEAMKDAMRRTGFRPYELVSDHGAALMSGEFTGFLGQWGIVHKPAQAKRARAKTIEPMQGVWMQNVLRQYYPNFSGMNITATSYDSEANPEFLKAALKTGEYTKAKVTLQIPESIARYNNLRLELDKPTRAELLKTETDAMIVLPEQYADNCLMWRKKGAAFVQYPWTADGIKIQLQKSIYYYYPLLEDESPEAFAEWMNVNAANSWYVKYDPTDLDQIALYAGNGVEASMRFSGYAILAPIVSPSTRWATDKEKADFSFLRAVQKAQTNKKASERMLGIHFEMAHKDAHNEAEQAILLEQLIGNEGILTDNNKEKANRKSLKITENLTLNSQFNHIKD